MTSLEERIEFRRRMETMDLADSLEQERAERRAREETERQEAAWKRQAAAYGRQLQRVLDDLESPRNPNRTSGYSIRWFQDEDLLR